VARGAHIYAEVVGAASTADAHHITAPAPHGTGAVSCMELALIDAGLTPDAITHINAHGTSTPANDLAEGQAIAKVVTTFVQTIEASEFDRRLQLLETDQTPLPAEKLAGWPHSNLTT